MSNCRSILRDGVGLRDSDRAFSWLPFYHDMGLVGFMLAPVMGQLDVDYLETSAFARRPLLWLKLMSQNSSTICCSPGFGYDLVTRRAGENVSEYNLSNVRVAGIGGDMVRGDVLERFADKFAPCGFERKSFVPSYGMAEATLAVSFSPVGRGLLTRGGDRKFVSCGPALVGIEVKICDEEASVLDEGQIGRILIKSPALMEGYLDTQAATRNAIDDNGFLDSGDLGFVADGELFLTGRAKDMILHNGRNIWPQDIEWAVEQLDGLRSGDVAAFAVEQKDGSDGVMVLVQCRFLDWSEQKNLQQSVAKTVLASAGVEGEILLVRPHSLPFTSSGKLARSKAREMYLAGEMVVVVADEGQDRTGNENGDTV